MEREVAEYTPHDMQRLLVKPGCSGLWQVSGRNEVGFEEMVDFDVEYMDLSKAEALGFVIPTWEEALAGMLRSINE